MLGLHKNNRPVCFFNMNIIFHFVTNFFTLF